MTNLHPITALGDNVEWPGFVKGCIGKLEMVSIDKLFIDDTYQRAVSECFCVLTDPSRKLCPECQTEARQMRWELKRKPSSSRTKRVRPKKNADTGEKAA